MLPRSAGTTPTNNKKAYPNPDQGWGRVNLSNSLFFEGDGRKLIAVEEGEGVRTGENWTYEVEVGDNTVPLEFTLAWTDYPGDPVASKQLVNDLDLRVTAPGGENYLGNNFTSYNPGYSSSGVIMTIVTRSSPSRSSRARISSPPGDIRCG